MNSTYFSIVIPVHRVEPYLRECLDSVAASGLDCWEAILVDDGSPDGCPQICDEYVTKDNRFRVIHQENAGVAAARNAGLDVAQGKWIWFVDSDDMVDMQPVGEMIAWLQEHKDTDLVMFDLRWFYGNDNLNVNQNERDRVCINVNVSADKNEFFVKNVCYYHQCFWYVNSKINRKIRFTQGIRVAEDLEFQYKYLTLCQHPVKMDATLYYYRQREKSTTGHPTYRVTVVDDVPVVLRNLALWCKDNQIKPEPWIDYRIMKLMQNMLYSASLVTHLDIKRFQKMVNESIVIYRKQRFSFVNNIKIRLAERSVRWYFILNKIYLKTKGYNPV